LASLQRLNEFALDSFFDALQLLHLDYVVFCVVAHAAIILTFHEDAFFFKSEVAFTYLTIYPVMFVLNLLIGFLSLVKTALSRIFKAFTPK